VLKFLGGAAVIAVVFAGWRFWEGWKQQFEEEK
jgi:hypothetical protein